MTEFWIPGGFHTADTALTEARRFISKGETRYERASAGVEAQAEALYNEMVGRQQARGARPNDNSSLAALWDRAQRITWEQKYYYQESSKSVTEYRLGGIMCQLAMAIHTIGS